MADLRKEKEAFVSGLSGTSLRELYLLLIAGGLGVAIRHCLLLYYKRIRIYHQENIIFAFFYEFLAVMLPGLLSFTILSEYFSTVLIPILLLIVALPLLPRAVTIQKVHSFLKSLPFPKRPPFLTVLRTWVNIYTSICILAVDFHVFPRRLAKAESYGTGLMDIGVGMFIINHGMVVKETHLDSVSISRYLKSLSCYIVSSRVWVFILLGLLRLLSVKSTDYQQHVSEYGVHWNFFFTIAAVKIFSIAVQPLVQCIPSKHKYGITSLLVAVLYQFLLSCGLRDYILHGPDGSHSRDSIIAANREGLFSCTGYLSIYYAGMELGRLIFMDENNKRREKSSDYYIIGLLLLIASVLSIVGTVASTSWIEPVSRRMANITFILWIVSMASNYLLMAYLIDLLVFFIISITPPVHSISPLYDFIYSSPTNHYCLISSIDYNQFLFFIIANISTGLVNVTINTMATGSLISFLLISLHIMLISLIVIVMKKLSLKLM